MQIFNNFLLDNRYFIRTAVLNGNELDDLNYQLFSQVIPFKSVRIPNTERRNGPLKSMPVFLPPPSLLPPTQRGRML